MKRYLDSGMLLTFLEDKDIPRTNNGLEGGINSQIKRKINCKRNISANNRNNIIMLYLSYRSKINEQNSLLKPCFHHTFLKN